MRISEVAEKTGLSISNIRFYEKKGLIGPDRDKDSKYRNYTEEDLALIKQILLFRKMDFSIETISHIINKKLTIETAIQNQITELEEKRDSIQSSIDLCQKIAGDGQYSSLDTDYYLSYVKEEEKKGRVFGQLNDLLDEVSDYYDYCFWNTPFAGFAMPGTKYGKALSVILLAVMLLMPLIAIGEDLIKEQGVSFGSVCLAVIWWGTMVCSLVGYRKSRKL
ncbi:MAG: MerR family transcriptional regulator [Lachnobacterium sp.]|nr:MerR family transcriptional regulator [Lachnobacterium sp.]MDD6631527.1 MerR family transcriptional regulator [Lachnobacterium sp.]